MTVTVLGAAAWPDALQLAADMEQLGPQEQRVRLGPGRADERLDRLGGQAGGHEPVANGAGRLLWVHVQLAEVFDRGGLDRVGDRSQRPQRGEEGVGLPR
jgi:hypothetical protein